MISGFDSSSLAGNRKADLVKARAKNGFSFAIFRASGCDGKRRELFIDRDFEIHYHAAKAAGYTVGTYHLWRVDFPVDEQVDIALEALRKVGYGRGDLPPWNDLEFGKNHQLGGFTPKDAIERFTDVSFGIGTGITMSRVGTYTSEQQYRENLKNVPAPPGLADTFAWMVGRHDKKTGALLVAKPWGDERAVWITQDKLDVRGVEGFPGAIDRDTFHPLYKGTKGPRVKWLQDVLGIPVTGTFDAATAHAVKKFQLAHGLKPDAIVGPATFAQLAWE